MEIGPNLNDSMNNLLRWNRSNGAAARHQQLNARLGRQRAEANEQHWITSKDGRGGFLRSFMKFLAERAAPLVLRPVLFLVGKYCCNLFTELIEHESEDAKDSQEGSDGWRRRRDKALAFFRKKGTTGLQGYCNDEMTHAGFPERHANAAEMAAGKAGAATQPGAESDKYVIFDVAGPGGECFGRAGSASWSLHTLHTPAHDALRRKARLHLSQSGRVCIVCIVCRRGREV